MPRKFENLFDLNLSAISDEVVVNSSDNFGFPVLEDRGETLIDGQDDWEGAANPQEEQGHDTWASFMEQYRLNLNSNEDAAQKSDQSGKGGLFGDDTVSNEPIIYKAGEIQPTPDAGPIILTTSDVADVPSAGPVVYETGGIQSAPDAGPVILTTPDAGEVPTAAPVVYETGGTQSVPEAGPIILTTPNVADTLPSIPLEVGTNTTFVLNDTGGAGVGTNAGDAFQAAADLWSLILGDDVAINLDIGFQTLNPGVLGSTGSDKVVVTYAAVAAALGTDATSADDATAVANLVGGNFIDFETKDVNGVDIVDSNNSTNNQRLSINKANAKALGITVDANGNPLDGDPDGTIVFSNSFTWDFDPTDGITSGSQDFVGVAFHEIGHALGFTSGVDLVDYYHGGSGSGFDLDNFAIFSTLDLFRYSSAGTFDFRPGGSDYFSIDGGTTNLGGFSTGREQGDGQQASHWKDGLGLGIMDPTANPSGNNNYFTDLDLQAFDVIGWDLNVTNVVNNFPGGGLKYGFSENDIMIGSSVADFFIGNDGDDVLIGNGGDDILKGDEGADKLLGGEGTDTVLYTNASTGIIADLADSSVNTGEAAGDTYDSIENLAGSSFYNDSLRGDDNANYIGGGGGNDALYGRGGADVLVGGTGNDALLGGAGGDNMDGGGGTDRAQYTDSSSGVRVDLVYANVNTGIAAGDTFHRIENVTGSFYDDSLRGNSAVNVIDGNNGDDILYGRGGDDTLIGGKGNDIMLGGTGADLMIGGSGIDTAQYSDATTGVRADLTVSSANTGIAAGDTYLQMENITGSDHNDNLRGSAKNNVLKGNDGNDVFYGRGAKDTMDGGEGNDLFFGGSGADVHLGGNGVDAAAYGDATSGVRADLTFSILNTGFAAGDTYSSIENLFGSNFDDSLRGNSADNRISGKDGVDILYGRGGNDDLFGGTGNDALLGGSGNDELNGGAGDDRFIFEAGWGDDVITDWENGPDFLDFRASASGLNGVSDLTINVTGGNTVISYGSESITLEGFTGTLDTSDWMFI